MRHPLTPLLFTALAMYGCGEEPQRIPPSGPDDGVVRDADMGVDAAEMPQVVAIDNVPGGNPLVPEHALLPFPSDFFLADDANSRTSRVLRLPEQALPSLLKPEIFADIDGFSRIPPIVTYLPGGYDPASLPDPSDPLASTTSGSPVWLLESPNWTPVRALVERDVNADDDSKRALIIRPLRALEPETTYVVVIRNTLLRADSSPHQAGAAFRALRDGTPTSSPELERLRPSFDTVRQAVAAQDIGLDEVVQAWTMTTRSEEAIVEPMLAMQATASSAPLGELKIEGERLIENDTMRVIEGSFEAPNFVGDDGLLTRDEQGLPISRARRRVAFTMTVPVALDAPRPVIVFGHGFFSKREEVTYSTFKRLCLRFGFSAIAVDFEGFDEASAGESLFLLSRRANDIDKLVAKQMQAYTHFGVLARVVREQLVDAVRGEGDVGVVDAGEVHYMGISNGATFGAVIASTSKEFRRAALVVGGGGLVHFLERATSWNRLGPFLKTSLDNDPLLLQQTMALLQHKLDPIDSLNYVEHLSVDRFEGLGELKASFHMAVHDHSVNNMLTEIVARQAKVPLIVPSAKAIEGLATIEASAEGVAGPSALVVYDEMLTPTPLTNNAPIEDNGAHGSVRALDVYQRHIAAFIERGELIQVCEGACDPD